MARVLPYSLAAMKTLRDAYRWLPLLPLALLGLVGPPSATPQEAHAGEQAETPVLELTLQDALRIALQNNLSLEAEQLITTGTRYDALGSWGSFDPVFRVTGTRFDSETPAQRDLDGAAVVEQDAQVLNAALNVPLRTGGAVDISLQHRNFKTNDSFARFDVSTDDVFTIALTQPLLRGGWSRFATSDQREAEIAHDRQREREKEVRMNMVLDVYNAYWDLVSAREQRAVRELAVELGAQQVGQDQRRLDVGAGTEVDVLQSETNLAQQEESRIQAEFDLKAAEDALRKLLFQKPEGSQEDYLDEWDWHIRPLTPLPPMESSGGQELLPWRRSLDRALENRPELSQARLDIDSAEVRLERARSNRLPLLDLSLEATGTGFGIDPADAFQDAVSYEFPGTQASLTFSMPIGNRTARNAVRSARTAVRSARIAYDQAELNILEGVRAAVRDRRYKFESVLAATKSLSLAQRQLEAEQARREIGLSTTFQVLEFQRDLAEALSTERAARAALAKSVAALAHAEGALSADPLVALPEDLPETGE